MKTKWFILLGVAMLTTALLAGNHNRKNPPQKLSDRVAALEQLTQQQAETIAQQQTALDSLNWMIYWDGWDGTVNVRGNLAVWGDWLIAKKVYYNSLHQF